jgi:activator of HSP90 ATPase
MPAQLTQATTYIKDLRERVEKLKQRRDQCLSKVQRATSSSRSSSNAANTVAATGSSSPHDTTVLFSGATHFNLKFTMSSSKGVQLHKVIRTILQDERVDVIEANSSYVDGSKIVYVLKCKVYM